MQTLAEINEAEEADPIDATKRRLIAYWSDDDIAAIRDPQLIQLAQREYLRGAEREAVYVAETLRAIEQMIARGQLQETIDGLRPEFRDLINKRHPGVLDSE